MTVTEARHRADLPEAEYRVVLRRSFRCTNAQHLEGEGDTVSSCPDCKRVWRYRQAWLRAESRWVDTRRGHWTPFEEAA
jgi:hypothetical protein